jgi:hypothetical protein
MRGIVKTLWRPCWLIRIVETSRNDCLEFHQKGYEAALEPITTVTKWLIIGFISIPFSSKTYKRDWNVILRQGFLGGKV